MEGDRFGTIIARCFFGAFVALLFCISFVACSPAKNTVKYENHDEEITTQQEDSSSRGQKVVIEPTLITPVPAPQPNEVETSLELYSGKGIYILMEKGMVPCVIKGAETALQSNNVLFIELRENKSFFEMIGYESLSLSDYLVMCLENNNKPTDQINSYSDEMVSFAYSGYYYKVQDVVYYYMVVVYESENYFYCTNFVCKATEQSIYEPQFLSWAKTAVVE